MANTGVVTTVTAVKGNGERPDGLADSRVIGPRPGLPGSRAVVGGLLMAVAAVGVFVAYTGAGDEPSGKVVVAAHALRVGEEIQAGDLRLLTAELPSASRATTFTSPDTLIGRMVLGPVGEGEILQAGAVTQDRSTDAHEVGITLPREQVAVGRLRAGELVDVFVSYDDRTSSVVRGASVVRLGGEGDRSLTGDREVSIVVAVPSGQAVAALVHALRTGEVTVVRSTFAADHDAEPLVFEAG